MFFTSTKRITYLLSTTSGVLPENVDNFFRLSPCACQKILVPLHQLVCKVFISDINILKKTMVKW